MIHLAPCGYSLSTREVAWAAEHSQNVAFIPNLVESEPLVHPANLLSSRLLPKVGLQTPPPQDEVSCIKDMLGVGAGEGAGDEGQREPRSQGGHGLCLSQGNQEGSRLKLSVSLRGRGNSATVEPMAQQAPKAQGMLSEGC